MPTRLVAMGFGSRVRDLREQQRASLRDVAHRAGVSAPMLSQVERGTSQPTLPLAERIAAVLDSSVGELLEHDEREASNA